MGLQVIVNWETKNVPITATHDAQMTGEEKIAR